MRFRLAQISLVVFLCCCALAQAKEPTLEGALANNYYFQKRYVLALAMASRIPANHPTSAQKAIETGTPHGEVTIEQP